MNLERLLEIWKLSREGADHYRTSPVAMFLRFRRLSKKFRVNPEEACRVGIIDPKLDDEWIFDRFISKYFLVKIQTQYNPKSHFGLTEDKAIFYALCQGHSLPHPKVLAIIGSLGSWTGEGTLIRERRQWEDFFENRLPDRFLIKPAGGFHGEGIRIVKKLDGVCVDNEGARRTAGELFAYLIAGPPKARWVLQEVLSNHPEIARLTGSNAISTARMLTKVETGGECRFFHAVFRVIVGSNVVDNVRHGQTGNLVCELDLEKGTLLQGKITTSKWGCRNVDVHPETGVQFRGFQLPDWEKARDLVIAAAPKFLPARMLGWDIAFTPEGPSIVETNACWDPMSSLDYSRRVIEVLREDYRKLI